MADKPDAPLTPESNPPVAPNPKLAQPLEKQAKPEKEK